MRHTPVAIKHLFHRKPLVMLAIALMTGSALITYFSVNEHGRQVMALRLQAQQMETKIHDTWYDAGQINRDVDAAVMVSLLAKNDGPEAQELKQHYLARLGNVMKGEKSLLTILKSAEAERQRKVDAIDDIYIEKVSLEEKINEIEERNRLFANIAFFLQIAGLALVIVTRDLPDGN